MPAIFDHEHHVRDDEIDGLGHVNNLQYLHWMLDAAIAHSSEQGWPPERHLELQAGWVVRSHFIEYLRPAMAGDRIVVRTWVSDFRKTTSRRKYRILRPDDNTLLAVAETNWVFICYQRRVPRRVPVEVVSAFEVVEPDPAE
jgi:acyl-CoA thioester hydrolase